MEEALIKRLMASLECGVCKQRYQGDNITILGHHEELWFSSLFCLHCHTQCLVVAVVKQGKEPAVTSDLTEAELAQFSDRERITADDVLDIHQSLIDFDGDFSQLFSRREA